MGVSLEALRAVPRAMTARLGRPRVSLAPRLDGDAASQWTRSPGLLDIRVATAEVDEHDVALEALLCLGQALWESTSPAEREAWWKLLDAEITAGVVGEIDEDALREKRALLAGRHSARSRRRLERYGRASFAATAAEYVHCMWHDVEIRSGSDYLPAACLRRRLELFLRWFPPNPGQRLWPGYNE